MSSYFGISFKEQPIALPVDIAGMLLTFTVRENLHYKVSPFLIRDFIFRMGQTGWILSIDYDLYNVDTGEVFDTIPVNML